MDVCASHNAYVCDDHAVSCSFLETNLVYLWGGHVLQTLQRQRQRQRQRQQEQEERRRRRRRRVPCCKLGGGERDLLEEEKET